MVANFSLKDNHLSGNNCAWSPLVKVRLSAIKRVRINNQDFYVKQTKDSFESPDPPTSITISLLEDGGFNINRFADIHWLS